MLKRLFVLNIPVLLLVCTLAIGLPSLLGAQQPKAETQSPPAPPRDPLRYTSGPVDLKFSIEGIVQGSAGSHPFWGLAQTFAPTANYGKKFSWLEGYLKPSLTASYKVSDPLTLYGGVAMIASGTWGTDYFEASNTGRVLTENAYLGARWKNEASDFSVDLSGGQQPYVLGNQLLLAVGAGNGFERGCVTLFPYRAWQMTGTARLAWKNFSLDGFYLDPNELKSNDTHTKLTGTKLEWTPGAGQFLGISYFKVIESEAPYPQAPVWIINNGRDGLNTYDGYWKFAPVQGPLAGFSFMGEVAFQNNSRINMKAWGAGMEIGYRFQKLPFSPRLSYSPRYYSGDNPGTPNKLERFDPLFGMSSPDTWSSGGSSSLAFLNSNIIAQRLRLDLILSQRDFMNLNYWYILAAEKNSPIQFGQAARVTNSGDSFEIISGVPDRELSHELYVEYTHMFTQHWFLTCGVAGSFPGEGIRAITTTGAKDWWGGLVNITFKY